MYLRNKKDTQKEKAYQFYNSYRWDKVYRPTFYQRVRLWWEEPREEKIKLKAKSQDRRRIPKGRRANEMIWYEKQPEPRASKYLFRNRLNGGYPKEKAILMGESWLNAKREKRVTYSQVRKTYTPKPKAVKPIDERDFKIEITYPKDAAKVFRKEYSRMIEQVEWELTYAEEKTQIIELNKRLEQLKREKDIFNLYNP